VAQVIGLLANAIFVFGAAYGFFRLVDRLMGNRVAAEVESQGLDELEMGADAYPPG
jgi:Amt family ammonium transporter